MAATPVPVAALQRRKREVTLCNLGLTQSIEQQGRLTYEVREAQDKLQSPFRNPFVMTTVGVVLGLVVGGIFLRK